MERTQAIDQGHAFLPCVAEDDLGLLTPPPTPPLLQECIICAWLDNRSWVLDLSSFSHSLPPFLFLWLVLGM